MRELRSAIISLTLATHVASAQGSPAPVQPVRSAPVERITIKVGGRDFGPSTIAGGTLYFGGPTGAGGLFAADATTGARRWSFRATGISGAVSTRPAVVGGVVIAPFGAANPGAVIGVSASTGKELWRTLDPSAHSAVVAEGARVFVVTKACDLVALTAATGKEEWRTPLRFVPGGACTTSPVVREGTVYAEIMARAPEGTNGWPDARYVAAFDAATGAERWRHRPKHPDYRQGADPHQPVITDRAVYFAGENALYALDRSTGEPLFAPVFLRRMVDRFERPVPLDGLMDAGTALVGATPVSLVMFDKRTGKLLWELPGKFDPEDLHAAVAGDVLYFQGGLDGAPVFPGTLHAFDLTTRTKLWSFTRTTSDPAWKFGPLLPVDGAIWVDAYGAVIRLQAP